MKTETYYDERSYLKNKLGELIHIRSVIRCEPGNNEDDLDRLDDKIKYTKERLRKLGEH